MDFTEHFWEERYRSHATNVWSGHVNAALEQEVAGLTPGTALDVGCGEGGDVLWLAAQGWDATGLDWSRTAVARAASEADDRNLVARFEVGDMTTWAPDRTYDLVVAMFTHPPAGTRDGAIARMAAAVAPGGTLLFAQHSPLDREHGVPRPDVPEMFTTAEAVAALLDPDAWDVVTCEERSRTAEHHGETMLLHDTVLRARRR